MLAIVGSIGIDTRDEGRPLVSLEIINPDALALGVGRGGSTSKVASWVILEEGPTMTGILTSIERRAPRNIFTGQIDTVVFGQNLARSGIRRWLDIFNRQAQFRRSVLLHICDTGSGLLQRSFIEDIASLTLGGLATSAIATGQATTVTVNEFLLKLSEPGIEPIAMHTAGRKTRDLILKRQGESLFKTSPAVEREQPLESQKTIPGLLPPESPVLDPFRESGHAEWVPDSLTLVLGVAVCREDRLVGFVDGLDARGYLWAVDRVKQTVVEVPDPVTPSAHLAFKLLTSQGKIHAHIRGNIIKGKIEVRPVLVIAEMPDNNTLRIPGMVQCLESELDRILEAEIRESLRKIQQMQSDIYGFGQLVFRQNPSLWTTLEPRWNTDIFPKMEVDVSVKSSIRSSSFLVPILRPRAR